MQVIGLIPRDSTFNVTDAIWNWSSNYPLDAACQVRPTNENNTVGVPSPANSGTSVPDEPRDVVASGHNNRTVLRGTHSSNAAADKTARQPFVSFPDRFFFPFGIWS